MAICLSTCCVTPNPRAVQTRLALCSEHSLSKRGAQMFYSKCTEDLNLSQDTDEVNAHSRGAKRRLYLKPPHARDTVSTRLRAQLVSPRCTDD
nr:hypothetical protein Iba_chr09fCG11040 [Ipomoea batatas]